MVFDTKLFHHHQGNSGSSLADRVNLVSQRSLIDNPNIQRREERVKELEEELRRYQQEEENSENDSQEESVQRRRKNYVDIQNQEKTKKSKKDKNK